MDTSSMITRTARMSTITFCPLWTRQKRNISESILRSLTMGMHEIVLQRIKEEIDSDPDNLGYVGKTPQEVLDLINAPVIKMIPTAFGQPLLRIISGIAEGPNQLSVKDIEDAINYVGGP
jgi:hypothetical protein